MKGFQSISKILSQLLLPLLFLSLMACGGGSTEVANNSPTVAQLSELDLAQESTFPVSFEFDAGFGRYQFNFASYYDDVQDTQFYVTKIALTAFVTTSNPSNIEALCNFASGLALRVSVGGNNGNIRTAYFDFENNCPELPLQAHLKLHTSVPYEELTVELVNRANNDQVLDILNTPTPKDWPLADTWEGPTLVTLP